MPKRTGLVARLGTGLKLSREYALAYLIVILVVSFFPSLVNVTSRHALSSYTNTVMILAAVFCLFLSWRMFRLHRETEFRTIGVFFVVYFAFWTIGEMIWAYYDVMVGSTPVPNVADAFWLVGYVPLFHIFASTVIRYKGFVSKREMGIVFFVWAILFVPSVAYLVYLVTSSPAPFLSKFVDSLYPVFDSLLLLVLFTLLLMYRNAKLETYWAAIGVGMLANAVGDILFLYYHAFGIYEVGSLPDNFLMLSYLITAFGLFSILRARIIYFETAPVPERQSDTSPRFSIERGMSYLFKEANPERSFEVFCDLITHGTSGLLFVRSYPVKVKQRWKFEKTPIWWLSNSDSQMAISPHDLNKILYITSEFLKKTTDAAVMIEGIEYLITENDYLVVLRIIHALGDLVMTHNARLIVSVNPETLEGREMTLLEKEMNTI